MAKKSGEQGPEAETDVGKGNFQHNIVYLEILFRKGVKTLSIFSCRIDALASVIIALELVSSKYANIRVGRGEESHKTRAVFSEGVDRSGSGNKRGRKLLRRRRRPSSQGSNGHDIDGVRFHTFAKDVRKRVCEVTDESIVLF